MSAFGNADVKVSGKTGQASALYQEKKPCALNQHIEDAELLKVKRQFVRTYSGASTEDLETPAADGHGFDRCFSDGDYSLSPASRCQSEHMDWIEEHMGRVKSQNDRMEAIGESFDIQMSGFGMDEAEKSGEAGEDRGENGMVYNKRLDALFDNLREAKSIFKNTYGEDVDEESLNGDVDEEGTVWMRTSAPGIAEQKDSYHGQIAKVQDLCDEVRSLWKAKYGKDFDDSDSDDNYIDGDNTAWVKTTGEGADIQKWDYRERLDTLDHSLSEVKQAYRVKYGERVEECDANDYVHDDEGTPWVRTEGAGIEAQNEDYFDRVDTLEASLAEVKEAFHKATGQDPEEEDFVDDDGTLWTRSVGDGLDQQQDDYDQRVNNLTDLFNEVKSLYAAKTGIDPDEPDFVDEDGMLWTRVEATSVEKERLAYEQRVEALLAKCGQAKTSFEASTNEKIDEEDLIDADGTMWLRVEGTGFKRQCEAYDQQVSYLESSLKNVQQVCC